MKNINLLVNIDLRRIVFVVIYCCLIQYAVYSQNSSEYQNNTPIAGLNGCGFGFNTLANVPANATCQKNVALGHSALYSLTSGQLNTAIGKSALYNTNGDENTGIGFQSLFSTTTGSFNTANGFESLFSNTTGNGNTALGYNCMTSSLTVDDNTAMGSYADVDPSASNQVCIGFNAYPSLSTGNIVTLGDASNSLLECEVGLTVTSDQRFKSEVKEDIKGLDFILRLKPLTYKLDHIKFAEFTSQRMAAEKRSAFVNRTARTIDEKIHSGFLAQQVEEAASQSGFTFEGLKKPRSENEPYKLSYALFVVPLVKAVQEQQQQIEQLEALINNLNTKQANGLTSVLKPQADKKPMYALESNKPNPFSEVTHIKYSVSDFSNNCSIVISNLAGMHLAKYPLSKTPEGILTINAKDLDAGIYFYSLVVDDIPVCSKRMIVTGK